MSTLLTRVFLPVILLARACGSNPPALAPAAYVDWVENTANGLHTEKQIGKMNFDLQYEPVDYVILKENPGKRFSAAELKNEEQARQDMQYYLFRISNENGEDLLNQDGGEISEFSSRLAYFSSGMQKDLNLIGNGDTLPCLLFHYERTFGVDPRSTFVLGFQLDKERHSPGKPADKIFYYNDHALDTGPVMITISENAINQLPNLKFE